MALQIRRGSDDERLGITPDAGEPIWTTDTNILYVGDGITPGGIAASPGQNVTPTGNVIFNSLGVTTTATVGTLCW